MDIPVGRIKAGIGLYLNPIDIMRRNGPQIRVQISSPKAMSPLLHIATVRPPSLTPHSAVINDEDLNFTAAVTQRLEETAVLTAAASLAVGAGVESFVRGPSDRPLDPGAGGSSEEVYAGQTVFPLLCSVCYIPLP